MQEPNARSDSTPLSTPSSQDGRQTLSIKVQPNADRNEIVGWLDDETLKIRVRSPAQDGKANKTLIDFLAKRLGVSKNRITILLGQSSRQKVIAFEGLSASQWRLVSKLLIPSDTHGQKR